MFRKPDFCKDEKVNRKYLSFIVTAGKCEEEN